jgi:nucleolar protein 14
VQTQRRTKKISFDLEDDEGPEELTHMGRSLSINQIKDDFEEEMSGGEDDLSDEDDHPGGSLKRRWESNDEESEEEEGEGEHDEGEEGRPQRKKSKQEVMKEVVAKSKLYKYERQAAKEDDDELREKLDKELPDIQALLHGIGRKPQPPLVPAVDSAGLPKMNPDRLAQLIGTEANLAKEYDMAHRKMAQDKRSVPTERTKTEQELAEETAKKLQELEAQRVRRMEGAPESDDEGPENMDVDEGREEDDDFGLGAGIKSRPTIAELGIEDEDDFLLDDNLVAESGSDVDAVSCKF